MSHTHTAYAVCHQVRFVCMARKYHIRPWSLGDVRVTQAQASVPTQERARRLIACQP
ncbi:hypothetical protein GCM10009862_01420 [Microbacterium binotii]|uniref:Uncharacterized protein n=1 Tax=Microbacterium binotii TaxID=462710 RepID=A0ABN3P6Q0_9MICO